MSEYSHEGLHTKPVPESTYAWLGSLLTQYNVWVGFGDKNRTYQSNVIIQGLEIPDMASPAHNIFWSSRDTNHARLLASEEAQHGYAQTEFDYADPNSPKDRSMKVFGRARRLQADEIAVILPAFNRQRDSDGLPQYPILDYIVKDPLSPKHDIAKRLYAATMDEALVPESMFNERDVRRGQTHAPVPIDQLLMRFRSHPEFPNLRFNRGTDHVDY
jgi:hypothetical protein